MTTRRFGLLAFLGLLALSSTSEAQGIYLKTSGGVSFGSDKIIEKNYGTMPLFNIGIGIDAKNGWAGEFDFFQTSKQGPVINYSRFNAIPRMILPFPEDISKSSEIDAYKVELRVSKSFGKKGELQSYVGMDLSYEMATQSVAETVNGTASSYSYDMSLYGAGVFAGVVIPISKNTSFFLEGLADVIPVPNSQVKDATDFGGNSVIVGVEYSF